MSEEKKSNAERLESLAGFDPAKKPKVTDEIFQEVMEEISQERKDLAKKKARETIGKAIGLREDMVKARRAFEQQEAKFEKELGALLNQIENDLRATKPPVE